MDDRSKHIDDLFREGLNDYRETPPASVWTSLEQRLPAAEATAAEQPSRRWLWILLLLALLAAVGYFIISKSLEKSTSERRPLKEHAEKNAPLTPSLPTTPTYPETSEGGSKNIDNGGTDAVTGETPEAPETNGSGIGTKKKKQTIRAWDKEAHENSEGSSKAKSVAKRGNGEGNAEADGEGVNKNSKVANTIAPLTKETGKPKTSNNKNTAAANTVPNPIATTAAKGESQPAGTAANNSVGTTTGKNTAPNGIPTKNETTKRKEGTGAMVRANNNDNHSASAAENIAAAPTAQVKKNTQTTATNTEGIPNVASQNKERQTNKVTAQGNGQNGAAEGKSKMGDPSKEVIAKSTNPKGPEPATSNAKGNTAVPAPDVNDNKATTVTSTTDKRTATPNAVTGTKQQATPTPPKDMSTPALLEAEQAKAIPIPVPSEKGTTKAINPEGAPVKGNPISVSSVSGKGTPVTITPEPNTTKEISLGTTANNAVTPEPVSSNTSATSGAKARSTQTAKAEPAAKPAKKAYERNEDGILVNMDAVEEEEEAALTPSSSVDPDEPSLPAQSSGGGGGGNAERQRRPRSFNKMKVEGGIKAGYDRGLSQLTTSNVVVSPFLQWNLSPRIGLAVQPGVKYNQINKPDIFGPSKEFHRVTNASVTSKDDTSKSNQQGTTDTLIRNWTYHNTYDSIVIGHAIKDKNYWEIEIPLVLKYYVAPNLSIFGGFSMTFGNIVQVTESRQEFTNLTRSETGPTQGPFLSDSAGTFPTLPAGPTPIVFGYTTPNISTANPVTSQNPTTNAARFGYLLGFSYELRRRFLVDFLVRQNISDMRYIPNEQVRKIYTQPYLRLTVGYKLFGGEKRDVNPNGL